MSEHPKIRGLSRMDYRSVAPGWFARYTREGVTFSKHFSDTEFGSQEASLEAAKRWHEEARRLLPPFNRREYAEIRKGNNRSGTTGVYRTTALVRGRRYAIWVASWSPAKGEKGMKRFAVTKYGEDGAKRRAIEAREEALKRLESEWPDDYWQYRRSSGSGEARAATFQERHFRDVFAFEGAAKYVSHRARERDRELRDKKVEAMLETHGHLFCELCGFSFEREYGEMGRGLIEVHHLLPLGQMDEMHKTRIQDLLCVCSNCHLVLHSGDAYVNLQKLRFIFEAKQAKKKSKLEQDAAPNGGPAPPSGNSEARGGAAIGELNRYTDKEVDGCTIV